MNIGFSRNWQLTNSQKRRLDMVNFAEENGVSAAVKEFGTTYKTVNLWINRYRREGIAGLADRPRRNGQTRAVCTNRSRSKLNIMKPRNRLSFVSATPAVPEDKEIKPAPVDIVEEIMAEPPRELRSRKEITVEKAVSEIVSARHSKTDIKTIQIGLFNLDTIDSFGELCQKYNLPSWQFTAFDSQTGGAWIAYSYEISRELQIEFLKTLSKHFSTHGILSNQINFELCYDSAISGKLKQTDTAKTEESPDHYFSGDMVVTNGASFRDSGINGFHRLLEDNFYYALRVKTVSNLLARADEFLLRYNYKKNFESPLNLPPNQLTCREYGNNYGPEILRYKPVLLKNNQANKARYFIGLKMIAGLFASIVGSVLSKRKKALRITSRPLPPNTGITTTPQTLPGTESADKFEYINLKNMNWGKPRDKKTETAVKAGGVRNRQEIINRARELLAQKRTITELKNMLPMTEGELSLLSQNITLSNEERNRQ
ncbi:MAG: hypothetical protein DRP51_03645 [Candidatus Zixiibacteriota bacterium]|nr:MAG: hypothetical protein DRP51_03645 [candidate division Zixibacteria bacterium]